ncbi:TonB-dependent siderophore receptor [Sphaerochaeta sp. S2]|uniref:TonB-dependent receptor plug domain-containing protein n=1 Tax=Sphaerochaeta sp. S2 TaxID=2798868 RepID=UPI0018E9D152|nr:TonB-dependent receptor [Sphaerochaeta sp. S2]MBJ2356669.1 TonB-dependent receptor [Sphaerochaeta sp. S2]
MQKRGTFSLVLLLTVFSLFATQDLVDLGTAYELVIAETPLSEAETNTASSVSVITQEQIMAYNAQTTAELVGKAIGTSFNSVGGLGSLQTVVIRGATSSKNLIYLDGVLLSSAHDGTVDLSIIPIDIIERIEIVKSGPGNLGRTNAIGGMVNIITKKGQQSETPFSLSFENGSFLPLAYGTSSSRNWLSLVDSQKLDFSYTSEDIVATIGGLAAQNAYTYKDDTPIIKLRKNAQVYGINGSISYNKDISKSMNLSSNSYADYQDLAVPGGYVINPLYDEGLTPDDYSKGFNFNTTNKIEVTDVNELIENVTALASYNFSRLFFHDEVDFYNGMVTTESTHNKHKASAQIDAKWNVGQTYVLNTGLLYTLDYVDSTAIGKRTRHTISSSAHGSAYFLDGRLSIHPSLNIAYLSDNAMISPNASLGIIYAVVPNTDVKASISYAEDVPTFSALYWPGYANPDLKAEKGINVDLGVDTKIGPLSYESVLFGRDVINAITGNTNIDHSVYLGTEQSVELELAEQITLQASYLYNKSYDLSGGNTFADNVEVWGNRNHTAKGSLFLTLDRFESVVSAEYLGATSSLDSAFLLNLSVNMQVNKKLKAYLAVDNVLNTSYELTSGYPMPGTKIRIGGTVRF